MRLKTQKEPNYFIWWPTCIWSATNVTLWVFRRDDLFALFLKLVWGTVVMTLAPSRVKVDFFVMTCLQCSPQIIAGMGTLVTTLASSLPWHTNNILVRGLAIPRHLVISTRLATCNSLWLIPEVDWWPIAKWINMPWSSTLKSQANDVAKFCRAIIMSAAELWTYGHNFTLYGSWRRLFNLAQNLNYHLWRV